MVEPIILGLNIFQLFNTDESKQMHLYSYTSMRQYRPILIQIYKKPFK